MEYSLESATDLLRRTPHALRNLLDDLAAGWLHGDEGPGTWSPYQVAGHLAHIEDRDWLDRTRIILEHGTDRVFDPVDREAGFERFRDWPVADVLEHFSSARMANLASLPGLVHDGDLDRRGVHPQFGEVTLRQLLATWVVHDLNHLGQIAKTLAKQYGEAVGPWRANLDILETP